MPLCGLTKEISGKILQIIRLRRGKNTVTRKIFKVALHVLSEKPKRLKYDFDLYWFTKNAKSLLINQNDKWLHYSVMLTLHIKNLIEWGWFNQYSSCFFKRWQWGPSKIAWNSDTMAIWLGYKYTKLVNFVSSRENSSENLRFAAGSSLFEIPNTFYSGDIYSKHSQKFP